MACIIKSNDIVVAVFSKKIISDNLLIKLYERTFAALQSVEVDFQTLIGKKRRRNKMFRIINVKRKTKSDRLR